MKLVDYKKFSVMILKNKILINIYQRVGFSKNGDRILKYERTIKIISNRLFYEQLKLSLV